MMLFFMTNQDSQKLWFKLWYQLIARVTVSSARSVFTVSEFSKAEIIRLLKVNADRIVVLGMLQVYKTMPTKIRF